MAMRHTLKHERKVVFRDVVLYYRLICVCVGGGELYLLLSLEIFFIYYCYFQG